MNINSEMLIKLARDLVSRRTRQSHDLVAVYLTGSVLGDEPLIGGTTDIDLVMVHKENPEVEREVQRVSYEVSFDIQHHHQSFYTFHRRLRLNAWLGPALNEHASILYDSDHWLEFIQAGVSSQYQSPENVLGRSAGFLDRARQQWFDLDDPQAITYASWVDLYFKAVYAAANAIAALSGPALTTRRLLLDFPSRAETVGKLSLAGDLARLIGSGLADAELYQDWRPAWEQALMTAAKQPDCPPNLHTARKAYFLQAADAMVDSGSVHAALWPMLESWRLAAQTLEDDLPQQECWLGFLAALGFTPESKADCISRLDAFLDQAEDATQTWKEAYGL